MDDRKWLIFNIKRKEWLRERISDLEELDDKGNYYTYVPEDAEQYDGIRALKICIDNNKKEYEVLMVPLEMVLVSGAYEYGWE